MLAVFQLLAVPMVLTKQTLSDLTWLFTTVVCSFSLAGVFVLLVGVRKDSLRDYFVVPDWKCMDRNERGTWIFFILLVLFQIVMSFAVSTPDGDDAYYVAHAQIAALKDTMYLEDAYTGVYRGLDARHVLAPFPMFIAFLARKSGMHAAAVAHSVLPAVLTVLTYLIFYKISSVLFPDREKNRRSVFMVLMAGIQIFGGYSIYTNETFFVTRTWQGKSVLANIAIPAALYILLRICAYTETKQTNEEQRYGTTLAGLAAVLFAVNLAGALASSLGLLLLGIMEGVLLLVIAVRNRKMSILPAGVVSMIPCAVYMLIYIYGRF